MGIRKFLSLFLSPTMPNPQNCMLARPHLENIQFALIEILNVDSGLLVECITRGTFKPIWGNPGAPEQTRLKALVCTVEEQCETICNPTQAVIAKALCAVDKQFQYRISKKPLPRRQKRHRELLPRRCTAPVLCMEYQKKRNRIPKEAKEG